MGTYLIVALGWAVGGFINGIAGFGAGMVAMPLVTPFLDMTVAVPSCTLIVLALNFQMAWSYRGAVVWKRLKYLFIGAVPGAILGVTLLRGVNEYVLKTGMGGFILVYALWGLFFSDHIRGTVSERWGYLAGFLSTAFGTAFGFNGPPLVVYTAMTGWSSKAVKGVLGGCFIGTGIIIVLAQLGGGLQTWQSFTLFLASTPAVYLGGAVGIRFSRNLGEHSYRKIVYLMLLAMGTMIVWTALGNLF